MKTAVVTLESAAPYSQSRLFTRQEVPALEKESQNDYELRNWRNKQHWDKKTGEVYSRQGLRPIWRLEAP